MHSLDTSNLLSLRRKPTASSSLERKKGKRKKASRRAPESCLSPLLWEKKSKGPVPMPFRKFSIPPRERGKKREGKKEKKKGRAEISREEINYVAILIRGLVPGGKGGKKGRKRKKKRTAFVKAQPKISRSTHLI